MKVLRSTDMKYLMTTCGQCLLNLLFILWLHKIDIPCSQVAVVAAERTSVVVVLSKKEEDSLVTHLSVVLKNLLLFPDDIVCLLVCCPNSMCAALPCLVALCSQMGEQKTEAIPRGSDAVWDLHTQSWSRCDCHCNCVGSLAWAVQRVCLSQIYVSLPAVILSRDVCRRGIS